MTRHLLALLDLWAGTEIGGVATNGTAGAMLALDTVSGLLASEVVSLHPTLKSLALAGGGDINEAGLGKCRKVDNLPEFKASNFFIVGTAELAVKSLRRSSCFGIVTDERLR